jgi:hypothetical protein
VHSDAVVRLVVVEVQVELAALDADVERAQARPVGEMRTHPIRVEDSAGLMSRHRFHQIADSDVLINWGRAAPVLTCERFECLPHAEAPVFSLVAGASSNSLRAAASSCCATSNCVGAWRSSTADRNRSSIDAAWSNDVSVIKLIPVAF